MRVPGRKAQEVEWWSDAWASSNGDAQVLLLGARWHFAWELGHCRPPASSPEALRSLLFPERSFDPLTRPIVGVAGMTPLAVRTASPRCLIVPELCLSTLSSLSPLERLSFVCFVLSFELGESGLIGFALLLSLQFFLFPDLAMGVQTRCYEKRCHGRDVVAVKSKYSGGDP